MEIALLQPQTLRIKSKTAVFFVDPALQKNTFESDGAIFLNLPSDFTKTSYTNGVTLFGPGSYELKGVKISATKLDDGIFFTMMVDSVDTVIGKASFLAKAKEKLREFQVAVISADEVVNQNLLGVLNASVVIFYGPQSLESAKALGKEVTPVTKYAVTKDKIPTETEVVVLG